MECSAFLHCLLITTPVSSAKIQHLHTDTVFSAVECGAAIDACSGSECDI